VNRVYWRWLTTDLRHLTEPQVKRLLDKEVDTEQRRAVVIRLHQRYCALRAKREREALMHLIANG
tara:strand:- start:214 stop:408 length:195 start_codon:yes stop_codon:yes gene_type:complete